MRNGNGQYNLPAGNPVQAGTLIDPTVHNTTLSDIGSEITNSLPRDGQAPPTANLPMGSFRHTNVANAQNRNEYASFGQLQDNSALFLTSVSGSNTITATLIPPIPSYQSSHVYRFIVNATNTGAVTLNINALGALSVNGLSGSALQAGELVANGVATITYANGAFVLVNCSGAPTQLANATQSQQGLTLGQANSGFAKIDAQGNISVGATTKTWDAMYPVIQQNAKTVYAADANSTYIGGNFYHASGIYKRLASGYGLMYQQDTSAGIHSFSVAATGAADSTISWTSAFAIDYNGNIGIGTTPLTWGGKSPAVQINAKTAIATDANSSYYGTNWYAGSGGADTAIASGYATQYFQNSANGVHTWRTTASVSAGGAISWVNAMVLSQAGILSAPFGMTTATQSATDNSTNVATTAQVQSAVLNAFQGSTASSGNLNCPNGYQFRHGTVSLSSSNSNQAVTFSTAFPNNCWAVVITPQGTQSGPTATSCALTYAKTGFNIANYTGVATVFAYIAIGA